MTVLYVYPPPTGPGGFNQQFVFTPSTPLAAAVAAAVSPIVYDTVTFTAYSLSGGAIIATHPNVSNHTFNAVIGSLDPLQTHLDRVVRKAPPNRGSKD